LLLHHQVASIIAALLADLTLTLLITAHPAANSVRVIVWLMGPLGRHDDA